MFIPPKTLSRILIGVTMAILPMVAFSAEPSELLPKPDEIPVMVRKERPRMFLNQGMIPAIRQYALTHEKDYYQSLVEQVRTFPEDAPEEWGKSASPRYGVNAMLGAFVWLLERDSSGNATDVGLTGLKRAKTYIQAELDFNERQIHSGNGVNWYSISRVSALAAYDWIHSELTAAEREAFAKRFIELFQKEHELRRTLNRYNGGGITGGFYGAPNLPWYIGLAFMGDGIADEYAEQSLIKGYTDHVALLDFRSEEDAGSPSIATGYSFGMYPFTEFNFMFSLNSATGVSAESAHTSPSLLPNWVLWNWIPTNEGPRGWGLGDNQNFGGFVEGFLKMHMLSIAHFYADTHPDRAALAAWVRQNVLTDLEHDSMWWPLAPLLTFRAADLPEAKGPTESWPRAAHFPSLGVVSMRSGWKPGDTFAVFLSGGGVESHRHYDVGHFIIHKDGVLALDSGTYGNRLREPFLTEYFYRSVAHNTLLIEAPSSNDLPAKVWGGPADTLDGGQYRYGGEQVAFTTNDEFTYIATDMTDVYHPDKAEEVTRQFVFIYPNVFVIYDRVEADEEDFSKAWLLHTAKEPEILENRIFRATQGDGVIHSRTLLPEDAELIPVGGEGKQFWSADKNYPPTTPYEPHELWGAWRMEVRPGENRKRDEFLHVLAVGDNGLQSVEGAELILSDSRTGVRIPTGKGSVELYFARDGDLSAWWGAEAQEID